LQTDHPPNQDEHYEQLITEFALTFAAERGRLREKSKFSPFFIFCSELANCSGK
jgi:hypothetical protein